MMYKNDFVATIKTNGKILREDGNTVFIPFGSEYSIYMKNLRSQRCVVKIEIDGQNVTDDGLVLGRNQTVDLERFLDGNLSNGNRFKFIQKTQKIQQHRGDKIDDGIVRIEFQYEKPPIANPNLYYLQGVRSPLRSKGISGQSMTYNNSGDAQWMNISSTTCDSSLQSNNVFLNNSAPLPDEGITVAGSVSNQQFSTTTVGAMEVESHVITLQLKGFSEQGGKVEKPVTVKTKKECSTCGRINKTTSKYCSECGTYLK